MNAKQIAEEIKRAARATHWKHGTDRAYIHGVYVEADLDYSPKEFKSVLVYLRRHGLVRLTRADLRSAMDQRLLGLGRTVDGDSEFDFVVVE